MEVMSKKSDLKLLIVAQPLTNNFISPGPTGDPVDSDLLLVVTLAWPSFTRVTFQQLADGLIRRDLANHGEL